VILTRQTQLAPIKKLRLPAPEFKATGSLEDVHPQDAPNDIKLSGALCGSQSVVVPHFWKH
jgi:hypothetical protein